MGKSTEAYVCVYMWGAICVSVGTSCAAACMDKKERKPAAPKVLVYMCTSRVWYTCGYSDSVFASAIVAVIGATWWVRKSYTRGSSTDACVYGYI